MLIDLHAHAPHPNYYNQHPHWGPFFERHADGDVKLRVGEWILTLGSPERKAAVRAGTLKIEDGKNDPYYVPQFKFKQLFSISEQQAIRDERMQLIQMFENMTGGDTAFDFGANENDN